MSKFESGFTQGTVGFGLDAFALYGLELDSGTGRSGGQGSCGVLSVDSGNHPESGMNNGFATFYAGKVDSPRIGYFGGDYTVNQPLSVSLYGSRLKDA